MVEVDGVGILVCWAPHVGGVGVLCSLRYICVFFGADAGAMEVGGFGAVVMVPYSGTKRPTNYPINTPSFIAQSLTVTRSILASFSVKSNKIIATTIMSTRCAGTPGKANLSFNVEATTWS